MSSARRSNGSPSFEPLAAHARGLTKDPHVAQAYNAVIQQPDGTLDEWSQATGITRDDLTSALNELQSAGWITPTFDGVTEQIGPRWRVNRPPDVMSDAFHSLVGHLRETLNLHHIVQDLQSTYLRRGHQRSYAGLDVLFDQIGVLERIEELERNAAHQIRAFDRPPYYSADRPNHRKVQGEIQKERMSHGVPFRVIYEEAMWQNTQSVELAMQSMADGEEARQVAQLPMKLFIIDDDHAIVPLDPTQHADNTTLVIHRSGLLTALIHIFEFYWNLAIPLSPTGRASENHAISQREKEILTLLLTGLTDEQIARHLRTSRSTVARSIKDLQTKLRANSRFQLGVRASKENII